MNPEPVKILTEEQVNDLLVNFFTSLFEWEDDRVLVETQAGVRPTNGIYMTLWWKSNEMLNQGNGEFIQPDNNENRGAHKLDNESYCTIQITLRGDNAYSLCNEARRALDDPQRFFDLWTILGFAGCDPVQDMSAPFGGKIQQRAFFNFNFYATFGREYPADWFDKSKWIINESTITIYS